MAESRYWRATAIKLGMPPDADPADIMLVEAGEHGLEVAKRVREEYQRTYRVLTAEQAARRKATDAPA